MVESIYVALALFIGSIYVVGQTVTQKVDVKTTTFLLLIVSVIFVIMTKPEAMWVFIYVALAALATLFTAYWLSKNVLVFAEKQNTIYEVPLWLPVFFTQGFLLLHWVFQFLTEKQWLEA